MTGSSSLSFSISHRDRGTRARTGVLTLPHGDVPTPAFLPVGTQGTVKATTPRDLEETGAAMILANTYHLALRPGSSIVREAGGLHAFMGWKHPILTDSGGYQVFSLAQSNRVDDDGVTFRSHIDGALIRLTPEDSIAIQNDLGADIIMVFDECPPGDAARDVVERAVDRTVRWSERSARAHQRDDQALFGILQGGVHDDLRARCAERILPLEFPGYAIGGVAVGEPPEEMRRVVELSARFLPEDRPRYVMGVGLPGDLADMVSSGVDLFDCVVPTRHARNASLFTADGWLKIRNARFERDFRPVEEGCPCYACRDFTRAYLRHLYSRDEMLAGMLGTLHNLTFFQRFLVDARQAIVDGRYDAFRERWRRWGRHEPHEDSASLDSSER